MKRIFTLLCALLLLLTSFSGMVASAAELDAASAQEVVVPTEPVEESTSEIPEDVVMVAPTLFAKPAIPATFATSSEDAMAEAFRTYLQEQFAQCKKDIPIAQFALPYNEVTATALMYAIWYEMPELFHCYELGVDHTSEMITNLRVSYRPYADTPQEYEACLREMEQGAAYLLRDVKGNDALTDVEKALVLHDRLAVWTEYDMGYAYDREGAIFSAYGALGKQSAVCQGYTLAYIYLLEQVGIQSDFCSSQKLNHAWNIVYIDGKPYYTDVTWDDPLYRYGEDFDQYIDIFGMVNHENFLRSLQGIRISGHNADDFPQLAAGTEYDSGHFWTENLDTSVELIDNDLYYMTSGRDGNVIWKATDSEPVHVFTAERYNDGTLTSTSKMLLMGREKDILLINPATGQSDVLCEPNVACGEYCSLVGIKFRQNKIWMMAYNWLGDYYVSEVMDFVDTSGGLTVAQQPKNVMVPVGSSAKTTVKVEGVGLTYEWYHRQKGKTAFTKSKSLVSDYFTVKMATAWDGAEIYCVISDLYGNSVKTDTVTLRMGNPAKITTQPATTAAPIGSSVKVTMKASGDGITYAWYHRQKGKTSFTVSKSLKSNTFSVKMSKAWDGAEIYCQVTDRYGQVAKSKVVKIVAGNPPKITTQPKTTYAPNGSTIKVTLKASGKGLTYAWYHQQKGKTSYTKSKSLTGTTFSVKMSSSWKDAKIYCVVTDQNGVSTKSSVVSLKMGNPAKITSEHVNNVVASGKLAEVTVKASGDGLTYQWYYAKKGSSKYTKDKKTTGYYTVKMSSSVDGRKVYCVIKDKYGNEVKTQVYTLYKGTPAKIKTQPKSTTAFSGKTAKFTVKASGSGLKYAWYYMKKGATKYTKSSVTKKDLSIKMATAWNGAKLYCVVTDKYGVTVKSSVVTLSLAKKATITAQPKSVKAYNGDTVKLSVSATGDGLTYQWYYAKKGSSSYSKISGATKASYSVKMSSSVNGRKVYCLVKDKYGNSVKSGTATLTMHSFDPIGTITGTWKSYAAYVPGYGYYELKGSTVKITSDKKATLKIVGNGTSNTFKFTWSFEELDGDEAYYYMESSVEDIYVVYSRSEKELAVVTQTGEVIVFKK